MARTGSASRTRQANVGFPRVSAAVRLPPAAAIRGRVRTASASIVSIGEKSMRYVCTLTKGDEKIATGTVTIVCVARSRTVS